MKTPLSFLHLVKLWGLTYLSGVGGASGPWTDGRRSYGAPTFDPNDSPSPKSGLNHRGADSPVAQFAVIAAASPSADPAPARPAPPTPAPKGAWQDTIDAAYARPSSCQLPSAPPAASAPAGDLAGPEWTVELSGLSGTLAGPKIMLCLNAQPLSLIFDTGSSELTVLRPTFTAPGTASGAPNSGGPRVAAASVPLSTEALTYGPGKLVGVVDNGTASLAVGPAVHLNYFHASGSLSPMPLLNGTDGIIGFGPLSEERIPNINFFVALAAALPATPAFGLQLGMGAGRLHIGADAGQAVHGCASFTELVNTTAQLRTLHWALHILNMGTEGHWPSAAKHATLTVLDSGSSSLSVFFPVYDEVTAALHQLTLGRALFRQLNSSDPLYVAGTCLATVDQTPTQQTLDQLLPTIIIQLRNSRSGQPFNLTLPASAYLRPFDNSAVFCHLLDPIDPSSAANSSLFPIWGNSGMTRHLIVHDLAHNEIGFAETDRS